MSRSIRPRYPLQLMWQSGPSYYQPVVGLPPLCSLCPRSTSLFSALFATPSVLSVLFVPVSVVHLYHCSWDFHVLKCLWLSVVFQWNPRLVLMYECPLPLLGSPLLPVVPHISLAEFKQQLSHSFFFNDVFVAKSSKSMRPQTVPAHSPS